MMVINDILVQDNEIPVPKPVVCTTSGAILGAVIVALRTNKGMKQGDLAAAVGVGPSTWSRIERGESGLSIEQLKAVAKTLNETPWHLLQIADDQEKKLAERGIHISESSASPNELATLTGKGGIAAGAGFATGSVTVAGFLGAMAIAPIVPIAGVALASILSIYDIFGEKNKTKEK